MKIFRRFWESRARSDVPATSAKVPAGTAAAPAQPRSERRSGKRRNIFKGARVLVIDDSPTILAALGKMLRSAGCVTLEALDAESGVALLRKEQPDLVFLDIILPGMNGFGALRMIRKDALTQHIPVIMISGNEHATEQFYANRIGADDFMKKPFSRSELFARIESLLDASLVPRRKTIAGDEAPAPAPPAPATVAPAPVVPVSVAPPPSAAQPSLPLASRSMMTPLEARKELAAMGLKYFDHSQFVAAMKRGDKLAMELFVIGGGVRVKAEEAD